MYNTLLVPLDGSAFGERALPLAMTLARRCGARIVLMRAASASSFPGADSTEAQLQALDEARAYLVNLKANLSGQGVSLDIAIPYGDDAHEILQEIETREADLVVMCTHGRSGLGRWIYGSVGEKVLASSPVPVVLVRPTGEAPRLEGDPGALSILVPLDGSAAAEAALPHARGLAALFGARLLLLRVVGPPPVTFAPGEVAVTIPPYDEPCRKAELYLAVLAQRLAAEGVQVETSVREGWPAETIAYCCGQWRPSLIVMAARTRTGVARLLLGNVAIEVVQRSPAPVMLVRPAEPA